jgi:hypothetical protein
MTPAKKKKKNTHCHHKALDNERLFEEIAMRM